jgi:hypothetical protein
VLVSLQEPDRQGAASYSFTGDSSRLYTYVWGEPDATEYSPTHVLSIDPCTGASTVISAFDAMEPLATDGASVYFQSRTGGAGAGIPLVRSDPLGQSTAVVSVISGGDYLNGLTVDGGRGYAVTGSTALVALALDGSAPVTLVPQQVPDRVRVWWEGSAVDDSYVYFYSDLGLERIPKGGGPTTVLLADAGASACGGSEPAADPVVVADDTYVYMAGYQGVRRVAKDGSASLTYPGTETSMCRSIALDDTYVYFGDGNGTAIRRVPKGGGAVELVATTDDVGGIVVTATSVYWLSYTRAVMKLDKP